MGSRQTAEADGMCDFRRRFLVPSTLLQIGAVQT
jgi:hypothetical protein